jgi:hypothetical protein
MHTTTALPFIAEVREQWLTLVQQKLQAKDFNVQIREDSDIGKLGIEVESSRHVALVEGWERAHCLDVVVLNLASNASTMLSAGPCGNGTELKARLCALYDVLSSNE